MLAIELANQAMGKPLDWVDELSSALRFFDPCNLLDGMQYLVVKGKSILVTECHLDVIRCADWTIELGPDGGDQGGEIKAYGSPETAAEHPTSHAGRNLKQLPEQHSPQSWPVVRWFEGDGGGGVAWGLALLSFRDNVRTEHCP
jgi:excinuclease ABC subunit A